ncbi:helix-turn-helix domain-containing protein [Methylopila turkensis]|uniref:AraC family transcriptional regulator n=1 Tax=Methylopila turkensis TaxID=1437816 RepID=A0A9W6JK63_9HYPH|nr:AraC family transcriptional regulator [Methylopila turkensis]GLK79171.1 AraC family transcriptional regulator [Methylopila turkensis]
MKPPSHLKRSRDHAGDAVRDVDAAGAPREIGRILDRPPALANEALRGGARLTRRWCHGELHADLPGMPGHVVMGYYGAAQDCSWRQGGSRKASRTRPGSITLIPEGHDGRWDVEGPIEVSHVYLSNDRLLAATEVLAKGRPIELVGRICFDDPSASRVLEMLSIEAEQGDAASSLFAEQAVDLLCLQLVRAHSSLGAAPAAPRKGLADWQVKRVTTYMRDFLDRELGLDELAGLVDLSRHHFCTAFRLATGQTPHEWLVALRMTRARQLLASHDLPVTSVALAVGYQTPSAFASSFRKATGVTPTAFRAAL